MIKITTENQVNRLKPGDLIIRYPALGDPEDELILDKGNIDKFRVGKYDPSMGLYELIIVDEVKENTDHVAKNAQTQLHTNVDSIEKQWRKLIKESRWWIEG